MLLLSAAFKQWGRNIATRSGVYFIPAITMSVELSRLASSANGNTIFNCSIEPIGGKYIVYSDAENSSAGAWVSWLLIGY